MYYAKFCFVGVTGSSPVTLRDKKFDEMLLKELNDIKNKLG